MEWAKQLLLAPDLKSKLTPLSLTAPMGQWDPSFQLPYSPGRDTRLAFSEEKMKFPKRTTFERATSRAQAIHSFANHELLAIEMMAAALLIYPHHDHDPDSIRCKRGIMSALRDEQKHLQLYVLRIEELGHQLGEYPLNDFFWRQMEKLPTMASFLALMALTFESANLDFALFYQKVFQEVGDQKTADVLQLVFDDELTHVGLGGHWLGKWRGDKTLWEYYREVLPFPMTPARSRGLGYTPSTRLQAGLPQEWVDELSAFVDPFLVTQRRGWNDGPAR